MTPTGDDLALLTDLYQLTMAASYFAEGMRRGCPASRSWSVEA
jgi:nicotinic acid phosphoribosyltransferase